MATVVAVDVEGRLVLASNSNEGELGLVIKAIVAEWDVDVSNTEFGGEFGVWQSTINADDDGDSFLSESSEGLFPFGFSSDEHCGGGLLQVVEPGQIICRREFAAQEAEESDREEEVAGKHGSVLKH
jgi:hypothetical protein